MSERPDLRFNLYLSCRSGLMDYASRLLGSREAAEDVVQEAFLRFVPAGRTQATAPPPRAYLFRIVRNLAVDYLRRRTHETRSKGRNAPDWVEPQPLPSPEETVLFCEDVRRAMDMIAALPPNQRIALEMVRFGGYSVEQVAAHLDLSVPTIYRLVQTAVATITLRLRQDPEAVPPKRGRP
ncbi:DNA-directed RNA polymerase sigma-70 factor [Azorhizobium oxalatiphilum]|uniref:DNA-directed RNA polymerase sigma-70 factor n=1 Tax=Azorhizobium oxalatiphilum TaxID=980631 RepID=A0A917BZ14_9HYPH|nr:RNA polymerase sigma factor [Azorhizobium oxalatiphilum]GGF63781.1 DNA-directed RNA polymerase sigma-70 factor [Azorhizobium oxalatiphilum]